MRPSQKLIQFMGFLAVAAALLFLVRWLTSDGLAYVIAPEDNSQGIAELLKTLWWLFVAGCSAVIIFDGWVSRRPLALLVARQLPHSLAQGVHAAVSLNVVNNSPRALRIILTELLPSGVTSRALPLNFSIEGQTTKTLEYAILPIGRGEAVFGDTWLRIFSPMGFWLQEKRIVHSAAVRAYPNFAPVAQAANISLEHQMAKLGIHLQQRRGEGSDFHQLREFRQGDSLRQIDWNATSRRHKPVSREYQDERDQDIIFLLDSGRKLRAKENNISLFDHALNALLLTGYVALRQGDSVGFMSFGGPQRWCPPLNHPSSINTLLNQLYDLTSTAQASDYLEMAQALLTRRKKRALVVVLTNAREEDAEDLSDAIRLLSSRHMMMVASLRDSYFDQKLNASVESFNAALSYCATVDYSKRRSRTLSQLRNMGAMVTDALPSELHLKLVQEYLRLKRSGRF